MTSNSLLYGLLHFALYKGSCSILKVMQVADRCLHQNNNYILKTDVRFLTNAVPQR